MLLWLYFVVCCTEPLTHSPKWGILHRSARAELGNITRITKAENQSLANNLTTTAHGASNKDPARAPADKADKKDKINTPMEKRSAIERNGSSQNSAFNTLSGNQSTSSTAQKYLAEAVEQENDRNYEAKATWDRFEL